MVPLPSGDKGCLPAEFQGLPAAPGPILITLIFPWTGGGRGQEGKQLQCLPRPSGLPVTAFILGVGKVDCL